MSSRFLYKYEFVAIANATLAFVAMRLFIKWNTSSIIASIVVLTNFYFYVLYFAAERLKFGFIFLIISLLYSHRKRFFAFASASVMSHSQSFIIYISILFSYFIKEIKGFSEGKKVNKVLIISFLILGITLWVMFEQIQSKISAYISLQKGLSIVSMLKMAVFFALTCLYTKEKLQALYLYLPLFVVALIFGGDRVNLYGYFIFLFYALRINRGFNIGVALTSIYFAFKTYIFLSKVLVYANGFTSQGV
ncbi:MAG: hypothetical protein K9K67_00790 [Bacteriovoracaceae bacterium]|nr:hypothetical protein [Bacteriovoracaceae bacterium]